MKVWWHHLSLHNKLQIPIQLVLLLVLLLAQIWVDREFERKLFEDAEQRAIGSATQSFLSLNAMMLNGNINQSKARLTYLKKMAGQDGVKDFHPVRGKTVQDQFGSGLPEEQPRDELDHSALATNRVQMQRSFIGGPTLRVVVPFAAHHDFHGTNCLECHFNVRENTALGAISLTVSLEREYAELGKVRTLLSVGQVLLQISLFFLIGLLIRKVLRSVVKLERTMLAIQADDDLTKRAEIESGDEVGHIAQVFNDFLAHIAELKRQLADKVMVLEKYHDRAEEEQRVGGFIMSQMTRMPALPDVPVHRLMRPVEHLSGDILIAARSPGGAVHILLADAIGHGLSAAVNVLPLCQTFYDLTEKGFSIGQIADDLNRLVNNFLPTDRFVSAALVSINKPNRVVEVWNGGIPLLLLFGRSGQVLQCWESNHLPLGIASGAEFSAKSEFFQYSEDCQLCLFSDGLPEAMSADGLVFGETRWIELLSRTEYGQRWDTLVSVIEKHLGGQPAHDDITLALVDIAYAVEPEKISAQIKPVRTEESGGDWRIAITLGAAELKYLDAVPLVTQIIAKMAVTREHHSALFMILSELFNNALDHGLLRLDSTLKRGLSGFDRYLESRDARLHALHSGKIEIEITPLEIEHKPAVKIRVTDSGEGFDYEALESAEAKQPDGRPYGRGIALVKSVAYKLEYSERGNEVSASYICA
jgi:serine phosphatase RsbU (regulator of sigma subunit)/anti-sigma regulatory factor (Ser/Thr protein kinase)